jgi:hypothetical protein
MSDKPVFDEKAAIEEALRVMRSNEPTVPRASVKNFLTKVGDEIRRTGELRKEFVDSLLKKLHDGEL